MNPTHSFGYWLRRRRKALDLTQEELAQRVGCVTGTIKNIEADARRPSKQLAVRLIDSLELVGEERTAFLKAARAELAVDQLVLPIPPAGGVSTDGTATASAAPDQSSATARLVAALRAHLRAWERRSDKPRMSVQWHAMRRAWPSSANSEANRISPTDSTLKEI